MIPRDQAILEHLAAQREPAVVACVNLQNFKPLNAVLGHARGDRILARL
jgi:GGDEF domain-containing protein